MIRRRDAPDRPAKRLCPANRRLEDFKPGSILEVELHNFMTYADFRIEFLPRLNLLIGPNGAGKSSIVCAIGIGLAGEPQILGRAGHIGDFVKRGEESGWTKISLRGDSPGEVLVITRKINKKNRSDWIFNDVVVTKKEVQDKVRKYNIQIDNLTQFLPQDRVCEFAKMNPIQLLEETEKAVGDPELSARHQLLIQKNEELKRIQRALESHETTLAHATASNAELEEDKQRLYKRTQLLDEAADLKKKIPWLKYDEKKAEFEQAKLLKKEAEVNLARAQDRCREVRKSIEPEKARKDDARVKSDDLQKKVAANEQKLKQVASMEVELSAKVVTKHGEIQVLHQKAAAQHERIEKAQMLVQEAAADVDRLQPYVPQEETLRNLKSQADWLRDEEMDKRTHINERESSTSQKERELSHCNRRLQEMNNMHSRLLQALKSSGAHQIGDAYDWVKAHRNEFKKNVFGPVLLEVRIANKEHARYVENHVANFIWKAFVTEDADDRDLLVRNLKQFDVPVINQRSGQFRNSPMRVSPEMRALGITTSLADVIEAPDVVKNMLIGQSGLDNSFIGTSETNRRADEASRLSVRDLWTPENHYRWTKSRYGGHISTNVSFVRQIRLFSENVDQNERNALAAKIVQLQNEMGELQGELGELKNQQRSLQERATELDRQRDGIFKEAARHKTHERETKNKLEQRKRALRNLERELPLADAEDMIREAIKQMNGQRVKNLIGLKECLVKAGDLHMQYSAQHLRFIELDAKLKEMSKEVTKFEIELRDADEKFRSLNAAADIFKNQLARAKLHAEEVASLSQDLQRKFAQMPDTIEEVEIKAAECEAEAAAVICNNENAILLYEVRCEEIRNLTAKAEERRSAMENCMKDIEGLQESWLPRLRELVENINETFRQNFMEMAVAGEVTLDEHGTDFDRYGILIRVQFRETAKLQVLSAHHQSGGALTYCPFRVVDEINQGMDPTNERKMFHQLVRAASQPDTPQCLLFTPKLLSGLDYGDIRIHTIFTGPHLEKPAQIHMRTGDGDSVWSQRPQLLNSQ